MSSYSLLFVSSPLQGNDVKAELSTLGKTLPAVFMKVVEAVCDDRVGESMELYQAMISYAHSGPEVKHCTQLLGIKFTNAH